MPENLVSRSTRSVGFVQLKNLLSIDFPTSPIPFRLVLVVLQEGQVDIGPACV
jgi:hypothetical protein